MSNESFVGWWYATGPAGKEFSPADPSFNIHRVVSDTADLEGCVTVENAGGDRFPLERLSLKRIARPPVQLVRTFTVVENAGYERETDVRSFESYSAAIKFRDNYYVEDEVESLHVEIACDLPDGTRTYEI
jgi:hypothetical protein